MKQRNGPSLLDRATMYRSVTFGLKIQTTRNNSSSITVEVVVVFPLGSVRVFCDVLVERVLNTNV